MTVKKRLLGNIIVTVAGILIIGSISLFAIFKIKASVDVLTGQSTPVQVKTLELQQTIERLSADFMRLGLSDDAQETRQLSETIDSNIKSVEGINQKIQLLGMKTAGVDTTIFRNIQKTIVQAVQQRHRDISLFKTETSNVSNALQKVEVTVSNIRGKLSLLNEEAGKNVNEAQRSNQKLNNIIKKVLTLQARLKDIEIIIADMETIKSKFKLSPFKERMKAVADSVQALSYEEGDPPAVNEVKDAAKKIYEQFVAEGTGLISIKSNILSNKDEEGAYLYLKKSILKTLDGLNSKVTETVDPFEMQMIKDRQKIEKSLNFQDIANEISTTGSAINLGIKELGANVRLVMLSVSIQELNKADTDIKKNEEIIYLNIDKFKKLLAQTGQTKMIKEADAMADMMKVTSASVGKILNAKKSVLNSDTAMQKAITDIKTVSADLSKRGEQQVKLMTGKQHDMVSSVNKTVTTSTTFMVIVSLIILVAVTLINGKIAASIINPLRATGEIIAAVENGDLTRKIDVISDDEIGQMCASFNSLVEKLHHTVSLISDKSKIISSYAAVITETVGKQATFSSQLSSSVSEISATMEELSTSSTQIAEHTGSVVEVANKSWKNSKEGATAVETITMKMSEISQENENNINEIVELGKKSNEITKIMELINKIADQTKLIAFNAAIEASSAGETGKRFGVVAIEIRRLADSVMESTTEIDNKITEILDAVSRLITASQNSSKVIQEGVDYASQTVNMLADIVNVAEETNNSAKQISLSTQQQKTASNQVSSALREIVSGASQVSSSIGQINSISSELSSLSDDLKALVEKFMLKNPASNEAGTITLNTGDSQ